MKKHFPIVIEQDEDNIFIVSCPVLRGCHSYGDTYSEAMNNIKEVILLCLEDEPKGQQNHFIGVRDLETYFLKNTQQIKA